MQGSPRASGSNFNSSTGFNKSNMSNGGHKRSMSRFERSVGALNGGGSLYDTPFILEKDKANNYRIEKEVEGSMDKSTEIPFLRSQIDPHKFNRTHGSFGNVFSTTGRSMSMGYKNSELKRLKKIKRRERGWDNYIKPISKYN